MSMKSYGMGLPTPFWGPKEYNRLIIQAILEPVRVELIGKDIKFPDAEGLASWFRTTWIPYTQRLPENIRDCFI